MLGNHHGQAPLWQTFSAGPRRVPFGLRQSRVGGASCADVVQTQTGASKRRTRNQQAADGAAAHQACLAVMIYVAIVAMLSAWAAAGFLFPESMAYALIVVALFAVWAASFDVWPPYVIDPCDPLVVGGP